LTPSVTGPDNHPAHGQVRGVLPAGDLRTCRCHHVTAILEVTPLEGGVMNAPANVTTDQTEARELARKRLQARRDFGSHVVVYVVVNAFLVLAWALSDRGYFWPGWVMAAWGIGLLLNGWDVYGRRPITEADIDRELHRDQ
jgi:hypothetical protein